MGDVLAVIFAAVFFVVIVFAVVTGYRYITTPKPKNPLADSNAEYYRVAQQAVRLLEVLLRDEMVKGVIRQKDRDEMQHIIDDFYSF